MKATLLTLVILALAACSDSTDNSPVPTYDIAIVSGAATKGAAAFDPNPDTISLATQANVKWGNLDATTHTVVSVGEFASGNIGMNGTFTHLFTTPGEYPYSCSIHPAMVGTIVVIP